LHSPGGALRATLTFYAMKNRLANKLDRDCVYHLQCFATALCYQYLRGFMAVSHALEILPSGENTRAASRESAT